MAPSTSRRLDPKQQSWSRAAAAASVTRARCLRRYATPELPPSEPKFAAATNDPLYPMLAGDSALLKQLPRDPEEQLRLGVRVVEVAFEEKARILEAELGQLRAYGKERQNAVVALERRVCELEASVAQGEQRHAALQTEHAALRADKASLQQEVRALNERLNKLHDFKRSILQSIKDDDGSGADAVGGATSAAATGGAYDAPASSGAASGYGAPRPYAPPGSAVSSAVASPAGLFPPAGGGVSTPCAGGAPRSPAGQAASELADGKDFFRQARLRLTYEQFNAFLASIKKLNDHSQTRDETLAQAQEIFGADGRDLFVAFRGLLSKHGLA